MSGKKKFTHLIYIGRFQPFHNGHESVLVHSATLSENVLIICGSANRPRTPKNPFSYEHRVSLIRRVIMDNPKLDKVADFTFLGASDNLYSDTVWATQIQNIVNTHTNGYSNARVGIIGCLKEESSYYLKMFPQWELVEVSHAVMNATDVRTQWFEAVNTNGIEFFSAANHIEKKIINSLPKATVGFINDYTKTSVFPEVLIEYNMIKAYKEAWEAAPYKPTFVTVDALVVQSAHILLVKRKSYPGKGQWALPGGFLDNRERIVDAMVRELREETKLKIPEPVIYGSIVKKEVFDHPDRSLRGRTITHTFHIQLPGGPLSPVKSSDDTEKAKWFPISEVLKMDRNMFEDHSDQIRELLGFNN